MVRKKNAQGKQDALGHARPIDPMSSDPSYAPIVEEGWFEILPNTEIRTHALGLGLMLILWLHPTCILEIFWPSFSSQPLR